MDTIEWYLAKAVNDKQVEFASLAHNIIMTTLPDVRCERKWSVPYYSYYKRFCYMNFFKDHLYLSFHNGKLLEHPLIDLSTTKMMGKFYVKKEEDLTGDDFIQILLTAAALQEQFYSAAKRD